MTAFSVHSVCMLNTQDQKRGTYAQSLIPFGSFIILTMGKKRTLTDLTRFAEPQYIADTKKIWAREKGGLLPSLSSVPSASYSEHAGSLFSFPLLQALQDRRLYTTTTRTQH